ncbi:hypothetical protein K445DRAFT_315046 [Daldinia sp. EC12]|nr:hypothetical protein F4774DRAFT_373483 [Daldinia eschscholtzii]OTB18255.1 hypothetical protein K445DRAFT_315046 [Daldinia sp. EC12]
MHVRSIIAILPIVPERTGSTAPKIVRWELVSILSEKLQWSWATAKERKPRTKYRVSRM